MRIRVVHETVYRYDRPVRSLIQLMRLTPRDHDGQHVLRWVIEPSIDGQLRAREDPLGNLVHLFSSEQNVTAFSVRVSGEVETLDTSGVVRGAIERVPDTFFLRETELTAADQAIRAFVEREARGVAGDPLGALHGLLGALHARVVFDVEPTHAATTAADAFALGRGVCQDLTHIFLAAARHVGLPARYVSGYFHRADGIVEQDAGHAWAEVKVPELGWVGFDPTNGISAGEAHVRTAVGLDYLGAAPVRGSRTGGGAEDLAVRLRVETAQRQNQG